MRSVNLAAFFIIACAAAASFAWEVDEPVPLEIGGRFTYGVVVRRDAVLFPWNITSNDISDPTRLMLDLSAGDRRMGRLYLKAAAFWEPHHKTPDGKRALFEQGDYFRRDAIGGGEVGIRLYANQRRFFTHSLIAPLLEDDRMEEYGDNIGARFDGTFADRIGVTALYSALGDELDRSTRIAYIRSAFAHKRFALAAAYAHENRPDDEALDTAVFKTELSAYFKQASLLVAYEQSGRGSGLFFPSGGIHLDAFEGDNFSRILPEEGAFIAEARLASLPVKQMGTVSLVQRYFILRSLFEGRVAGEGSGTYGYSSAAYFLANEISLNGRLIYSRRERSGWESVIRDNLEASVWAQLRNGSEVFLRGGVGEASGSAPFTTEDNYIHAAWRYEKSKLRTGIHFMLKDVDTIFSERRFAWDCKLAFGGNMAIYWRAVIAHNSEPMDAIYARFEYRPNQRLFLTAGYGRSIFGDDPFVLEDADIYTLREVTPQYSLSIRGDF
jgi:hypothetical protein